MIDHLRSSRTPGGNRVNEPNGPAAAAYAAQVDAALTQRTRLRGPQPPGDLFAALPPDHPLLTADPRRPLDGNLAIVAAYLKPDDVIVDVGGGAGRFSLPLALHSREVVNVDPSAAMLAAFEANARRADIANVRTIHADWLEVDPPSGSVALVNHVAYYTREIVPFLRKLERAATRRVIMTVGNPPPPTRNRDLFPSVFGELEALAPGHAELAAVLREMGIDPEVQTLPDPPPHFPPAPTREAAIQASLPRFAGEQWAFWPLGPELETRLRAVLEERFDELFERTEAGYPAAWIDPGHEVLITWEPRHEP
jgi:SAM-dependent methyltransferase